MLGLLWKFAETRQLHYPIIACFVTGPELPNYCAEMPRSPNPPTGAPWDENFSFHLATEIAKAPALHDGAIIFSRGVVHSEYRISGWSYRLLSPHCPPQAETNRGSAYNSAISMSLVEHVDLVALVIETGVEIYVQGKPFKVIS